MAMQDAHVENRIREPRPSIGMQNSIRELNHRFLDLVSADAGCWRPAALGFMQAVSEQVTPLSAAQKAAASNCPYALFDLRFHDVGYWQSRLRASGDWTVADELSVDRDTLEFVRLALFFAWHVASTSQLEAQLLLGMHAGTAVAFRRVTIDCLAPLAVTETTHLTARWNDCPSYWTALTGAAARPNLAGLRRVQLYGLQLAAAANLT